MPVKTLQDRLRALLPERLRTPRRAPMPSSSEPASAATANWPPDDDPGASGSGGGTWPPDDDPGAAASGMESVTEPGPTTWGVQPKKVPGPGMRLPPEAAHAEGGWVQYNVGDPVEFDAHGQGRVSAVHVSGPPATMPKRLKTDEDRTTYREERRRINSHYPYRALKPGEVTVENAAIGTVVAIRGQTVVVQVPAYQVEIQEDALRKREERLQERLAKHEGGYRFGFDKSNVIPLKIENERVWARRRHAEALA